LLLDSISLDFHNTVMAAAGDLAVSAAQNAAAAPGYILAVEGAIPTGAAGKYCWLWPGMTMYDALTTYAPDASFILAIGACASYGGVTGGAPNPTEAHGVGEILGDDPRLINVPGCPCHPDWLVGTISYLLTHGHTPPLDDHRRPLAYYGKRIHDNCPNRATYCGDLPLAPKLSEPGCMEFLGCKGKKVYADCFLRKWNSSGPGEYGVNWCVGSRSPCFGCVEPGFPDAMSPFYVYSPTPEPKGENGREISGHDRLTASQPESKQPREGAEG
jgi:hydrogenase small subunit